MNHIEQMLAGFEMLREQLGQDAEFYEKFRNEIQLVVTSTEVREDKVLAYADGFALIHPKTYAELRRAAVEQLRLLPFPDDKELAFLIYCGCTAMTREKEKQRGQTTS